MGALIASAALCGVACFAGARLVIAASSRLAELGRGGVASAIGRRALGIVGESARAHLHQRWRQATGLALGLGLDAAVGRALIAGASLGMMSGVIALPMAGAAAVGAPVLAVALATAGLASWMSTRSAARGAEVVTDLPYALDLMVLATRAGGAMPLVLARVGEAFERRVIGREVLAMLREVERGRPRRQAMEVMTRNVRSPEFAILVETVLAAEELGRPVGDALDELSTSMREQRVIRAEQAAGKAAVAITLPGLIVFIAALMVLFAPFVVRWANGDFAGL